jgi:hypothetical protein
MDSINNCQEQLANAFVYLLSVDYEFLNGEGYSKLKQFVKENEAVLAENNR